MGISNIWDELFEDSLTASLTVIATSIRSSDTQAPQHFAKLTAIKNTRISETSARRFVSISALVQDDGLSLGDMGVLIDSFGHQPLDFFGAMRASLYDNQIRRWIETDIVGDSIGDEDANLAELSRRLVDK